MDREHQHGQEPAPCGGSSRTWIAFAVLAGIAAFFVLAEHRAHLYGFLPYLLLLVCPLMHLVHHGGHGGRRHGARPRNQEPARAIQDRATGSRQP